MNSNMVKPEKIDHLHLVYHFAIPWRASGSERNKVVSKIFTSKTFVYSDRRTKHYSVR